MRGDGTWRVRRYFHARLRVAAARRGQHAFTLDFNHAGAAVAYGFQALLEAQVRHVDAFALGDDQKRFIGASGDGLAVQFKADGRNIQLGKFPACHCIHANSWGKYLMTQSTGFGAA